MRVGIVGAGWGRTHVGTFRAAGCEIAALVARDEASSRAAAEAEGVPAWTLDALDDVDVIVIATPTPTHRGYLDRFADRAVLCEKPLVGEAVDPTWVARLAERRLWVSYAYPFLASAAALAPGDGALEVLVSLPGIGDPRRALLEVAVHPLAWLTLRLGAFTLEALRVGEALEARLAFEDATVSLRVAARARPGIEHRVMFAERRLEAIYEPGAPWRFEALEGDRRVAEDAGPSPWYDAHVRMVGRLVAHLRDPSLAPDDLFDGPTAARIERGLGPAFTGPAGEIC